jgi:hypothetical protein
VTGAPVNKWSEAAVVVLAAITAFLTAYKTFNDSDAVQDAKIDRLAMVVCTENQVRAARCQQFGLLQMKAQK